MSLSSRLLIFLLVIGFICISSAANARELEIKGAMISTESKAREIAFRNYISKLIKTRVGVRNDQIIRDIRIITLGYKIEGFAETNTVLWEARVTTDAMETRSIIWVHPYTGNVHFVIGPWEEKENEFQKSLAWKMAGRDEKGRVEARDKLISRLNWIEDHLIKILYYDKKIGEIQYVDRNGSLAMAIDFMTRIRSKKATSALVERILVINSDNKKNGEKKLQSSFLAANALIQIGKPAVAAILTRLKTTEKEIEQEIISWVLFQIEGLENSLRIIKPIDTEKKKFETLIKRVSEPNWEIKIEKGK